MLNNNFFFKKRNKLTLNIKFDIILSLFYHNDLNMDIVIKFLNQ